jgi:hypothetical protein
MTCSGSSEVTFLRSFNLVILFGSVILVSSCDRMEGGDPNLQMTFSCHGDRRIENFNGEGKPDVINEKVSHSITFWRWIEKKRKDGTSPWNKYKVNRFVLDGNFENLTRHELLPKDVLKNVKMTDNFYVFEQFGTFTVRLFTSVNPDPKNRGLNDRTRITFNFITKSLDIDVEDRDGTDVWRKTYDRTRCEPVTDPDTLKEMSVISS